MRNYKVKEGIHFEGNRKYKKGEVVTSSVDLVSLFPEKFEDLGPAPEGKSATEPSKASKPEPALVGAAKSKKKDWVEEDE